MNDRNRLSSGFGAWKGRWVRIGAGKLVFLFPLWRGDIAWLDTTPACEANGKHSGGHHKEIYRFFHTATISTLYCPEKGSMKKDKLAWGIANIALIAGLAFGAFYAVKSAHRLPGGQEETPLSAPAVDPVGGVSRIDPPVTVPDRPVFRSEKGEPINLRDFKGKIVVLNYWSTWCPPCVKELPSLAALSGRRQDVIVVPLSFDQQKSPTDLRDFLDKNGASSLDVFHSAGSGLIKLLPSRGLPTSFLISPSGQVLYKIEGDIDWTSKTTLALLDQLAGVQ